jgi:hypothetical protein
LRREKQSELESLKKMVSAGNTIIQDQEKKKAFEKELDILVESIDELKAVIADQRKAFPWV